MKIITENEKPKSVSCDCCNGTGMKKINKPDRFCPDMKRDCEWFENVRVGIALDGHTQIFQPTCTAFMCYSED